MILRARALLRPLLQRLGFRSCGSSSHACELDAGGAFGGVSRSVVPQGPSCPRACCLAVLLRARALLRLPPTAPTPWVLWLWLLQPHLRTQHCDTAEYSITHAARPVSQTSSVDAHTEA